MANKIINSLQFNSGDINVLSLPYGECSTAAGIAIKTVTVENFALETGAQVLVTFQKPNTASHITLDVNETGPKTIMCHGSEIPVEYIKPNGVYEFIYKNGVWELVGDIDTNTAHGHISGVGITMTDGDGGISGTVGYKAKLRSETALSVNSSAVTTTSGRVYPVAVDKSGYLAVNVPWTDSNTDTKVTQTVTTTNDNYPLLLAPSGQTATKTTTSYFDSGVTLNPSTNTIAANISGNAGTAAKLETTRTISISDTAGTTGTSFDGTANINLVIPTNLTNFNRLEFSTSNNTFSPTAQSIVLNGVNGSDDNAKAPGIGFHIGNKNWASLKFLPDGTFRFYNNGGTGYQPVYASTFYGELSGTASNATTFGDGSFKVYVTAGNEINFGGTFNSSSIFFGYRAKDSKPIPSRFYFGGTYGTGTVVAKTFEGTATNATRASTATKATQDENGNNIASTYQKKTDAVGAKITAYTGAEVFNNYTGNACTANYTTAMGSGTWAWQLGECVVGLYNKHKNFSSDNEQFAVGTGYVANGTEYRSNGLIVTNNGDVYFGKNSYANGADYAEYFDWEDANINIEDRRGYFVTLDNDKIKIAKSEDYILGVVSGNPSIVGNGDMDWQGRYLKDEFGSIIQHEVECEEQIFDKETNKMRIITKVMLKNKENPEYDTSLSYISRSDRPEWDAIGMMGVLAVRDDGTCQVNSYCKVTDEGIATASDTGYRVITRVNDHVIKIILK